MLNNFFICVGFFVPSIYLGHLLTQCFVVDVVVETEKKKKKLDKKAKTLSLHLLCGIFHHARQKLQNL